jgi:hypothetical protein
MNFIEAVKELSEGRCKGIKREEWFYKIMLVVKEQFVSMSLPQFVGCTPADYLAEDWQLVDPIPQTEEVEVVRWMCRHCETVFPSQDVSAGRPCCWGMGTLIQLTGHYTREVKPKVKRREDVSDWFHGRRDYQGLQTPDDAKCYVEWEEMP